MARQGKHFSTEEVHKIVYLLSSTDMDVRQIAERMQCSRSVIVSINRKFQVRDYGRGNTSKQYQALLSPEGRR